MRDVAGGADDLPARYGGEEFALLMPGAEIEAALATAERLRRRSRRCASRTHPHRCGQVTVSIGVASLVPDPGENAEALIETADIGLYAAKRRGRNTVVAHDAVVLAEAS